MIAKLVDLMPESTNALAVALFSEILTVDQLVRNRLTRVLPKGMEISHFSVLNHLARSNGERTPAQLAKNFHVTRGAMTNTLGKLISRCMAAQPAGSDPLQHIAGDQHEFLLAQTGDGQIGDDSALNVQPLGIDIAPDRH